MLAFLGGFVVGAGVVFVYVMTNKKKTDAIRVALEEEVNELKDKLKDALDGDDEKKE